MQRDFSVAAGCFFTVAIIFLQLLNYTPHAVFRLRLSKPAPPALPESDQKQAFFFVFGDSYTATGWDSKLPAQSPSAANPLGPARGLVTIAGDGLTNWVGKLTLDHLPLNYTTLTYDYASGLALVTGERYPMLEKGPDFANQTEQFLDLTTRQAFHPSQGVAILAFGSNDLFAHSMSPETATNHNMITLTMDDYWSHVIKLYDAGIKNFVILLAQPLHRVPKVVQWPNGQVYVDLLMANRIEWNKQLLQRADAFKSAHADCKIGTVGLVKIFDEILDNPVKYKSPNNICTNRNGVSCLWTDTIHPGQAIHASIADHVAATLEQMGFYPPSFI